MARKSRIRTIATLVAFAAAIPLANAADNPPRINFNEDYVAEVTPKDTSPDFGDAMSVFDYVFSALKDEVTVLPTENYYYFRFYAGGISWAGNIRFDIIDRDKGVVHFAYFQNATPWMADSGGGHRILGKDDGVVSRKVDALTYDVTYKGRTVRFRMNDLSKEPVPRHVLRKNEIYLGPIFDESGIEFHFIHDTEMKTFLYVLNESRKVADKLEPVQDVPEITIGRRTGFAFYRDDRMGRKILIGVHQVNVSQNTYFDGPFDQLPDNFLDRKTFRAALKRALPGLPDTVDDFGNFENGTGRVLINPYTTYSTAAELVGVVACTQAAGEDDDKYYSCFQLDE